MAVAGPVGPPTQPLVRRAVGPDKEEVPQLIDVMLPKVEPIEVADNFGRYQVEPLEPGFGVTIGNALRRVLLSSLPGAAVTSIKIENVYHEFSAIPGVKEDTTELVLNVKQIRLRSFADRPVSLRIESSGT